MMVDGRPFQACANSKQCEQLLSRQKADGWLNDGPLLVYRASTTSCEMTVLPVKLSSEGYGFALPASAHVSVLRELNTAIVQLSERSILAKLESTYFVNDCITEEGAGVVDAEAVDSHTIAELGGLFVLLGVFMVAAVLIRFLRLYW